MQNYDMNKGVRTMVKKIAASCMAMVLGTSLYAKDFSISERILGLEIGSGKIQADTNGDGITGEADHDGTDVEYGLRIGAQMNEWRTLLVVDFFDSSDDDQNYEKAMITFDYMFLSAQESIEGFQPYLGLNVGYMNYESTDIDEDGLLYGGQVGFSYRFTERFGVDVSYRYSLVDADSVDHMESIVLGLNYIY
jgi:opacity protein-like surface antigen